MFKTKSLQAGMIEFEDEADIKMQPSTANLSQVAFFAEYTR